MVVGYHSKTGTPMSRHQSLNLKAGSAVICTSGHQSDPRVLEEFEVAVHSVWVGGAELLGPLLPENLWNCVATFPHTGRTVGTHLK